jgi:hypothetical protein
MEAGGQRRAPVVHQENLMFLWKYGQTDRNVHRMKQSVHSRNMKSHFHCICCRNIFLFVCRTRKAKNRHGVEVNVHCNGKQLAPTGEGTVKSTVSNSKFRTVLIGT